MKTIAQDYFERYYTEKLWEMIPAIYRHEDGIADHPHVLRSMVEVLAGQAAILRRSQDRLWEDQFIELSNDWAVPYIADLLGTRLISASNKRGRRVDAAKTIYYRRRKGTPRILEELISDITGWDGKIVENFLRLGRARHGLDPMPVSQAGQFSGTHPGGWADLRNPQISEVNGGPFDEFFHTPDVRRHRGQDGRYNIPKLAIHLYRLISYPVVEATPFPISDGTQQQQFTFDPSGRLNPLFNRRNRNPDWDEWHSALEWELSAPMRCRLLGHGEYLISEAAIQILETDFSLSLAAIAALRNLAGWKFQNEARLRLTLTSTNELELIDPTFVIALLKYTLVESCGKQALLPNSQAIAGGQINPDQASVTVSLPDPDGIITAEYITSAHLPDWSVPINPNLMDRLFGSPRIRRLAIDPEQGQFMLQAPTLSQDISISYYYGFSGPVGAGTYDRRAVEDSEPTQALWKNGEDKFSANLNNNGITQIADSKTYILNIKKNNVEHIVLQASNYQRPYLVLTKDLALKASTNSNSTLTLDGLWVGCHERKQNIIIKGNYECVEIRNCTLDPGDGFNQNAANKPLFSVSLIIEGFVENLNIQNSILGPIVTRADGTIEQLCINDSIVQSIEPSEPAIEINSGIVDIARSTVFGKIYAHRLNATELLATDLVKVQDIQTGCFRFSAAPSASRVRHPYESFLFDTDSLNWFTSRCFGHPGYAQLSSTAPLPLQRGAENSAEMGAFNHLLNPIKLDGLHSKIEEYMPFGLIPIFINET